MYALNVVDWDALFEHEVFRCLMHPREIVDESFPCYLGQFWQSHPHLEEFVGSSCDGGDASEDVHATFWRYTSVVEEKRSSQTSLAEAHPPASCQRQFPHVVERTSLIVTSGHVNASLFTVKNVLGRVLHQRVALARLRKSYVGVWICRDTTPSSFNEIVNGQCGQVKNGVGRSSPENVNEPVVDSDFVSIPTDWLVGVDFRSAHRQQLPLLSREVDSENESEVND